MRRAHDFIAFVSSGPHMKDEMLVSAEPKLLNIPCAASAASAVQWHEGVLALPQPFVLESGACLADAKLAWTCVGADDAPVVVVLGGISAHRRPLARDGKGWWESQCGAGKALDTNRYRILGVDWLGGCDASSGPLAGDDKPFPSISTADQARAVLYLLNRLGIRRVHLIVGASYGGNVAQHLAALLGDRLRHLLLLSAAHKAAQYGLALRHVQRAILDLGADSPEALALARSLAVLGYRTAEGIETRFAGEAPDSAHADGVLGWVGHHGRKFVRRFNTAAYRCLGESLDAHCLNPADVRVRTTVFAVREDLTVPLSLLREYRDRAAAPCEWVEISSNYGHDAFLKEESIVSALFERCLQA